MIHMSSTRTAWPSRADRAAAAFENPFHAFTKTLRRMRSALEILPGSSF